MQYKLNMLLWVLSCVLFAGSCQRDETTSENLGTTVNLGLTVGTYALGDGDPNALTHEKQIRSLYVFIYKANGQLENPGKTKVSAANGDSVVDASGRINDTWTVYEGLKTIYVMANVPEKLKTISGSTAAADVLNAPTLAVLKELCSDTESYYTDYCQNQTSSWKGGLMSGGIKTTVIAAKSGVTVPLTRRYARIDLAVRKSPELASATVKVTGLQSQNFCSDVRLLALTSEWRGHTIPLGTAERPNAQALTSDYTCVRPQTNGVESEIYIMPTPLLEEGTLPVSFQLTVDINGKTELYTIYLAQTVADGIQDPTKPTTIQANKIYKINVTLLRRSTDVDITIKDWEDRPIQGDIAGSYLSFSQQTIIMDWWALGQTFKANVDYISDGTVSFVGYVTKDANGVETVTTNGMNLPLWLPAGSISGLPNGTTTNGTINMEYCVGEVANADVPANHAYLRFKTGNIIKDIHLVYDNGFIPRENLLLSGWTEAFLPDYGIQVAKRGNIDPDYDALEVDLTMPWANTLTSIPAAQAIGFGMGMSNTDAVIAALGADPTNSAAAKCRALGPEWYLMSQEELFAFAPNSSLLSSLSYSFKYTPDEGDYWSSSEHTSGSQSWSVAFAYTPQRIQIRDKTKSQHVRCVRNL